MSAPVPSRFEGVCVCVLQGGVSLVLETENQRYCITVETSLKDAYHRALRHEARTHTAAAVRGGRYAEQG